MVEGGGHKNGKPSCCGSIYGMGALMELHSESAGMDILVETGRRLEGALRL